MIKKASDVQKGLHKAMDLGHGIRSCCGSEKRDRKRGRSMVQGGDDIAVVLVLAMGNDARSRCGGLYSFSKYAP